MTYQVGSRYPAPGDKVKIVQKKDYSSGKLIEGIVKDVLTKKQNHPRGHKVRLTNGIIGRVQEFSEEKDHLRPSILYKPSEDDLA
ncbi:MAG TPA: YwbE family protein [Candidatus Nanoarchaeia archaeon]